MAGETVYADLRHLRDSSSAEKHCAPAFCPWWHRLLLIARGLGQLILLVLVVVLSVWVFQGSPQPVVTSVPQLGSGIQGRNQVEQCMFSSLVRYFCKPRRDSPRAYAGCKLCPQDWQLRGERCYWLSEELGNWTPGMKSCENQDSQLVVLQEKKEKEHIKTVTGKSPSPVWIGLRSHQKVWRWVDNTPFNPKMLGTSLHEMDEGCGTLRAKDFEVNRCDAEHNKTRGIPSPRKQRKVWNMPGPPQKENQIKRSHYFCLNSKTGSWSSADDGGSKRSWLLSQDKTCYMFYTINHTWDSAYADEEAKVPQITMTRHDVPGIVHTWMR
ncbi:killer cell lectin-like receptor subfamily B member 1F isoform X3 [Motacilla alba alba]|uniref:killer cell lectin-like receptor subfamily B member 1F isoform X3 n=1 Tax=Motacilla alba alba TaxID=1094192 RepID=UPI0018D59FDE|nr:killer cell lectin-like receptor subfamily B member 1F isoform X3 [Motacilla alba alba]